MSTTLVVTCAALPVINVLTHLCMLIAVTVNDEQSQNSVNFNKHVNVQAKQASHLQSWACSANFDLIDGCSRSMHESDMFHQTYIVFEQLEPQSAASMSLVYCTLDDGQCDVCWNSWPLKIKMGEGVVFDPASQIKTVKIY